MENVNPKVGFEKLIENIIGNHALLLHNVSHVVAILIEKVDDLNTAFDQIVSGILVEENSIKRKTLSRKKLNTNKIV